MWILNNEDYREYQAYKATGLSPNDLQQIKAGLLPDSEDRAPLPPLSDPDFEYDRRLELRDDFRGADLTREDIHLGSGLLEDE